VELPIQYLKIFKVQIGLFGGMLGQTIVKLNSIFECITYKINFILN